MYCIDIVIFVLLLSVSLLISWVLGYLTIEHWEDLDSCVLIFHVLHYISLFFSPDPHVPLLPNICMIIHHEGFFFSF